ncbi:hypothetical protein TNCV_2378811 [Trichonephila clavipes]|uniref:Uncharacterized protein n=1 Tax=Trichonephila clavipes TaxID=2585209 RepID=A0A8X6RGX2_TRICX|nr:hypothetical protein TNCV_2378811 [Trichonephila clavipes]
MGVVRGIPPLFLLQPHERTYGSTNFLVPLSRMDITFTHIHAFSGIRTQFLLNSNQCHSPLPNGRQLRRIDTIVFKSDDFTYKAISAEENECHFQTDAFYLVNCDALVSERATTCFMEIER